MSLMTTLVDETTKTRRHGGLCVRRALRRNETGENKPRLIHGSLFSPVSFLCKPPSAAGLLRRPGQSNALRVFVPSWPAFDKRSDENHENQWKLPLIAVLLVLASACSSHDPIRAKSIQLGRSINPDGTVGGHTTRFKPNDTIYASVLTTGSGSATISARWTYAGRVAGEPQRNVRYRGDAATEFHIQNNGGFPPGDYSVELFVNGVSAGSREFRVEK